MNRNSKLDNVKFFLICCVVLGHIGNYFSAVNYPMACGQFWIYLFHMPAFIFMSGLFSKRNINEKRYDRIAPYILLYLLIKMIEFIRVALVHGVQNAVFIPFHEDGVAWYAIAMFWWSIALITVKRAKPSYVLVRAVFLAIICGYTGDIGSFLSLKRTLVFFPFFYAGYLTDPDQLCERLKPAYVKICRAALILISVAICFVFHDYIYYWFTFFKGIGVYSETVHGISWGWGWLCRLISYVIAAGLTLSVIAIAPEKESVFSKIGQRTLSVFTFHYTVIVLLLLDIKWLRPVMTADRTGISCILLMLIVVLFTSLPVFDRPLRKVMTVVLKEEMAEEEKKVAVTE